MSTICAGGAKGIDCAYEDMNAAGAKGRRGICNDVHMDFGLPQGSEYRSTTCAGGAKGMNNKSITPQEE
eukprot:829398-Karenia_brevis.AAC.1